MNPRQDPRRLCTYCRRRPVRPNPKGGARNECRQCHAEYMRILRNFGSLVIYCAYRNRLEVRR